MTATSRPGRRIACVAVLAAVPLSACAAGYQAETSRERTTLNSVGAAKGPLTLRNIFLVGPGTSGDNLPLYLAIFNGGTVRDKLLSVSSPSSSGGFVPANSTIAPDGQLFFNEGDGSVPELIRLKGLVRVAQTVQVTLRFAAAGELTITIPVDAATPELPGPSPILSPSTPTPTPVASVSPTASASAVASASTSATVTLTATPSASAAP